MCQDRAITHSAIQVEDRGVVVECDFAGRIHPEGVAGDIVCQTREPLSNKEEQLDEMNGEQGAPEGRREQGGSLIMLDAGCKDQDLALGQPEVAEDVDVPGLRLFDPCC